MSNEDAPQSLGAGDDPPTVIDYPFEGVPLKPAVLVDIARRLFSGQVVKRSDMAVAVEEYHVARGGLPAEGDLLLSTKKALAAAVGRGDVERVGAYGMYRFPDIGTPFDLDGQPEDASTSNLADEDEHVLAVSEWKGSGSELVYAYFFPGYRDLASRMGRDRFPIKIGMSVDSGLERISGQVGTALPEWPVVAIAVRTDDSRRLERILHDVLTYRGASIADAPGSEWFYTNPDEVRSIVEMALQEAKSAEKLPVSQDADATQEDVEPS